MLKTVRLKKDFEKFKQGVRKKAPCFSVSIIDGFDEPHFAVIASKKNVSKHAVDRNLARRRIREVFMWAKSNQHLKQNSAYLFIIYESILTYNFEKLKEDFLKALK